MSDSKEVKVEFNQSFTVTARLSRFQDQIASCFINNNLHLAWELSVQIISGIWPKLKKDEREEVEKKSEEIFQLLLKTTFDDKNKVTYNQNFLFLYGIKKELISFDRRVKELQHKYGFYMMEENDPRKAVTRNG